jgi:hypothetical protein
MSDATSGFIITISSLFFRFVAARLFTCKCTQNTFAASIVTGGLLKTTLIH